MIRLKQLRVMKELSQRKLADQADVDASYINRAEKHKCKMYPEQEKRVMDALHFNGDPSQLYEEVNTDDLAIS